MARYIVNTQILQDQYTLVASSITSARLWKLKTTVNYSFAFVAEGAEAPSEASDAVPIFRDSEPDYEDFSFDSLIDLYVYAKRGTGSIRVDIGAATGSDSGPSGARKLPTDQPFTVSNGAATTFAALGIFDSYELTVANPTNFSIGDIVLIKVAITAYIGTVLAVIGPVLEMDEPLNYAYPIGSSIESRSKEMNVDGSETPIDFEVFVPQDTLPKKINICRILGGCLTEGVTPLSAFGDIANGLTYGLLLRSVANQALGLPPVNQWSAKTNNELKLLAYDWDPTLTTNPAQGQNGFHWRYSLGGDDKHGMIPQLKNIDKWVFRVQDNLSTLQDLQFIFGGNYEV